MSEQNKALMRRVFEEIYNQGKLTAADELAASDFAVHMPSQAIHGREGVKQYVAMLRAGFPDIHFTIEEQVAEGDRVVTRWTARSSRLRWSWAGTGSGGRRTRPTPAPPWPPATSPCWSSTTGSRAPTGWSSTAR